MKFHLAHPQVGNRICEACFLFFYGMQRRLPGCLFRKLSRPFLRLFIRLAIPRKRVVRNLSAAFGNSYTAPTKEGIARGVQENFLHNLLDCFWQLSDPQHARKTIEIRGAENLQTALAKGKGVIALGAHIGNFVLVGTRLGIEGHRFHTLFRIPTDARIERLIAKFLPRYHQSVIPSASKRRAVTRILDALKRNEIVHILGDNLKKGRIDTSLFGQRVPSPRGPISLALRTQAPVVPMYLVRNYQGAMNLVIEPEIELTRDGNLLENIERNTRRMVLFLESLIRKYPDQWNWLTVRLWKQGPSHVLRTPAEEETKTAPVILLPARVPHPQRTGKQHKISAL
jgi:KDO2-lipid IV(A) lauroyltransferase